jgi:phosphate uptake regulator
MIQEASDVYWGKAQSPEERTALYKKDVEVNKLERRVRKQIIAHLTGPQKSAVPYALLIMSLVKDAERLGDYAKNLLEVSEMHETEFPNDERVGELQEIRHSVEGLARAAREVFEAGNEERATELTREGRNVAKRCDDLIRRIAAADYDGATAVSLTLGARFYKRIDSHLLNLLSGIIMPLHKLDYFDEKAIQSGHSGKARS